MLNTMRSIASGFIAKALLLFLVITFGVWGIGDIFRSGAGSNYAARVGDDTISMAEFEHNKSIISRQMQAMGVQGADANKLSVGILRQLVQQKLILKATDDLGLAVNENLLAQSLKNLSQFQNLDGQFSASAFKKSLADLRMNEGQFLAQLRNETAGKFLLASLDVSDVVPPAAVANLTARAGSETRDVVLMTIPASVAPTPPSDAQIQAYYDENKATLYMEAEKRSLEYVTFAAADVDALIDQSITPSMMEDAKVSMTAKPSEAASEKTPEPSPEKIRAHLRAQQRDSVLRALSNKVEDALAAGGSLGEAVAKAGVKAGVKATSNLLTDITAEALKTESDDVLKTVKKQGFQMGDGEISNIITTQKGTILMVSVKAITPAAPQKLEQVIADVKTRLGLAMARDAARQKAQALRTELGSNSNWQNVATSQHITATTVSNLQRPVDGAASNSAVPLAMQQAIFEREVGTTAGPLALANGDQLLALVQASHHTTPVLSANAKEKINRQIADGINQKLQSRAFNLFAERHPVDVNQAALRTTTSANSGDEQ
jgi:peptidyl-prolyl cis-trans isomerase D